MTPADRLDLSVVVAAYNEEAVIVPNLRRIVEELSTRASVRWEIVCVNDGSADRTGPLADQLAHEEPRVRVLHHRRNFGQGRALRTAFDACRGEVVVTLDADLSYGPQYIYFLADALALRNVEIALASPFLGGGSLRNVPLHRSVLSRLGNLYLSRMFPTPIATSTCVARAYNREVLDRLILTSDGSELLIEILMKASILGFHVCEVPAHLEWAGRSPTGDVARRVSKMKILRSIRLYMLMGWLSRPAFAFVFLSLLLILPGSYMALVLLYRLVSSIADHLSQGFLQAISAGLASVFSTYTYSVAFASVFLLIGLQVFAFALILLQNKSYYEELSRLIQQGMRVDRHDPSQGSER